MAKQTALQCVNAVLSNIGEPSVSALTSLTGIQLVVFNKLLDAIQEIAAMANWTSLEASGTTTLTTSTNEYSVPTDMVLEYVDTFRCPDADRRVKFISSLSVWDDTYPAGITDDMTGYPTEVTRIGSNFVFNRKPTSAEDKDLIYFRYKKTPTIFATATATSTCWFPEGTEYPVLIKLATYKTLIYKNSPEAPLYYNELYGRDGTIGRMISEYVNIPARTEIQVSDTIGEPIL